MKGKRLLSIFLGIIFLFVYLAGLPAADRFAAAGSSFAASEEVIGTTDTEPYEAGKKPTTRIGNW